MARSTCNIETLSRELTDISGSEWFSLGIQLGVKDSILRDIEANHRDVQRRKTEMLGVWLQNDPTNPWRKLATTLENMGKKVLAQRIVQLGKCNTVVPQTVKGNGQNVNVKDHDLLDPSNPDSRRHVHDRCQTDKLDKEAQMNYASFAIKVAELLRQREIDVDDLILAWSYLDENTDVPQDIREANSITSFVQALRHHQTWYNYGGLRFLATHFGRKEGERLVKIYEGQLKQNVKQRVKAEKVPKKASRLVVKLNWKNYSDQDVVDFRNMLARVLKRGPHEFVLKSVREGCIELVYIIPSDLCESIRSLMRTIDLEVYGVMDVTINGESIWSKSGNRQPLADPETKVVPDSKRIRMSSEGDVNAASTAWKPYFSGARTIVCKYPEGYGRYGPAIQNWDDFIYCSAHLDLWQAFPWIRYLYGSILGTLVLYLLWEGFKPYETSHVMIVAFCFVLGCICCSYLPFNWRGKVLCRYCLYGILCFIYFLLLIVLLFGY